VKVPAQPSSELTVLTSCVCRGCPLLCDDVAIRLNSRGEPEFDAAICETGTDHYRRAATNQGELACRISGRNVGLEEAIDRLAEWLQDGQGQRLFAGIENLATVAQQAFVRLVGTAGGWIGAPLYGPSPAEISLTRHGRASATLGDTTRQPATVLLFAEEGAFVPPRLFERFVHPESSCRLIRYSAGCGDDGVCGLGPHGFSAKSQREKTLPSPRGFGRGEGLGVRGSPRKVAQPRSPDQMGNQTFELSEFTANKPDVLDAIRQFRASATGLPIPRGSPDLASPWGEIRSNTETASAIVVYYAAAPNRTFAGPDPLFDGLNLWVQQLNRSTPAALIPLDARANSASAANVLAWTWGISSGGIVVDNQLVAPAGDQSTASRIIAGDFDLLLWIDGTEDHRDPALLGALQQRGNRRLAVIGSRNSTLAGLADLLLPVAEPGWDDSGDFWRVDEIPLRLDKLATSQRPSAVEVLCSLAGRLIQVGRGREWADKK
jgi:formylmethanofuran dehydrogenase subunit B